jgi:hypothetical protein
MIWRNRGLDFLTPSSVTCSALNQRTPRRPISNRKSKMAKETKIKDRIEKKDRGLVLANSNLTRRVVSPQRI